MKRVFLVFASLLLFAAPASAERDHDRARRALERGEIRPLSAILPEVEERFDARLLEVELEREHDRFVYEMELIAAGGQILEVQVDAASGEVLEHEIEDDD
jgi:uncharacterized membrane protein YkoI